MGTEPPVPSISRWRRPRLYLTIYAFYLIASSLGLLGYGIYESYLDQVRYDDPLASHGSAGGLAVVLMQWYAFVLYLTFGIWSAISLLRRNPRFRLSTIVTIVSAATAVILLYIYVSRYLGGHHSVLFFRDVPIFSMIIGMSVLFFKGQRDYFKTTGQPSTLRSSLIITSLLAGAAPILWMTFYFAQYVRYPVPLDSWYPVIIPSIPYFAVGAALLGIGAYLIKTKRKFA